MASQALGLAPDFQDEVLITVQHLEGQPPHLSVLRRRVTFRRGSILLGTPEAEPISESASIAIVLELLRAATMQAVQLKESLEGHTANGVPN